MPSRSAAPWLTTTASPVVIPGSATASATRCSAPPPVRRPRPTARPSGGVQLACSTGYRVLISVSVSPSQHPPDRSRRSLSSVTSTPARRPSAAAVPTARVRSEETMRSRRSAASSRAGPLGLDQAGLVERDVALPLEPALGVPHRLPVPPQHQPDRPRRLAQGVLPDSAGGSGAMGSGVSRGSRICASANLDHLGQRDLRAVLPDPLERVVGALLGVLRVDHHVEVVEEHPAALPFALAADQARARLAHPQLDLVDDGLDLAVVQRRAEQERVGDNELIAHVIGGCAVRQLVRRGQRGGLHKLDGPRCGSHGGLSRPPR